MNKTAPNYKDKTMISYSAFSTGNSKTALDYADTTYFSRLTGKEKRAESYYCSDSSSDYRWIKAWRISETEVVLQNPDNQWQLKTKKFETERKTVKFLSVNRFTFQEWVKKEAVPHIVEDDKGNMELLP